MFNFSSYQLSAFKSSLLSSFVNFWGETSNFCYETTKVSASGTFILIFKTHWRTFRYQIKENIRTLNLLLPLVQYVSVAFKAHISKSPYFRTQFILNVFPVFMWLMYQSVPHGFDPRGYPIFEVILLDFLTFFLPSGMYQRCSIIRNRNATACCSKSQVRDSFSSIFL